MAFLKYSCAFVIVLIHLSLAERITENRRSGKFFGTPAEVTKLSVDNLIVTTIVPSSCVSYEPTLKPCRRFRFLNYGPLFTQEYNQTQNRQPINNPIPTIQNRWQSIVDSTPPLIPQLRINTSSSINSKPTSNYYWGDYFNFIRGIVTKTKTATRVITETYYDPARVITFSIKHCLPSKMPFDLPKCSSKEITIKQEELEQEINHNIIEPTLTWSIPAIETTSGPEQLNIPSPILAENLDNENVKPSQII